LTSIFSPRRVFEVYANALGNYADNLVTATRLGNNMIFANMEVFKTSLRQAKDIMNDLSRIGVNAAKAFEQISRDTASELDKGYFSK
jgi:hypothetical protein